MNEGEVESVYITYNFSHFFICLPEILKIDGNLTKFWQKQFCTVFSETRCISGTWMVIIVNHHPFNPVRASDKALFVLMSLINTIILQCIVLYDCRMHFSVDNAKAAVILCHSVRKNAFCLHYFVEFCCIVLEGRPSPVKSMMLIEFLPYFHKIYKFPPYFVKILKFPPLFSFNLRFLGLI